MQPIGHMLLEPGDGEGGSGGRYWPTRPVVEREGVAVTAVMVVTRSRFARLSRFLTAIRMGVTRDLDTVNGGDLVGHVLDLVPRIRRAMQTHRRHEGDGEHQTEETKQARHRVPQTAVHTGWQAEPQRPRPLQGERPPSGGEWQPERMSSSHSIRQKQYMNC